jgi:hypothetical protein
MPGQLRKKQWLSPARNNPLFSAIGIGSDQSRLSTIGATTDECHPLTVRRKTYRTVDVDRKFLGSRTKHGDLVEHIVRIVFPNHVIDVVAVRRKSETFILATDGGDNLFCWQLALRPAAAKESGARLLPLLRQGISRRRDGRVHGLTGVGEFRNAHVLEWQCGFARADDEPDNYRDPLSKPAQKSLWTDAAGSTTRRCS